MFNHSYGFHILLLVINSLGMDTHTHTHTLWAKATRCVPAFGQYAPGFKNRLSYSVNFCIFAHLVHLVSPLTKQVKIWKFNRANTDVVEAIFQKSLLCKNSQQCINWISIHLYYYYACTQNDIIMKSCEYRLTTEEC